MTTTDTPALFTPDQRAALAAVGFTDCPHILWQSRMNYRESDIEFVATPSNLDSNWILLENEFDATLINTETEIRAFVARFTTQKP